jgi:hypothetical protein
MIYGQSSIIAFKKNKLAISRPDCAILGRPSITLSSSSILLHMKDRGVPSMANPFSGTMIHWVIIPSASPSTRVASPAVLLNQIDPTLHNLNMTSSNFFFLKAKVTAVGCPCYLGGCILQNSFAASRPLIGS